MKYIQKADPEIAGLIMNEQQRQNKTLMMIPSENFASYAVEEAVGSCLENKYAEGYPYKRYYQGQKYVDKIENLVIERAKKIFKVEHVNVQPYSGSPANFAVYNALLSPQDIIMGLSLSFGGHLTHGAPASATSRYFRSVQYELGKNNLINYEDLLKLAIKTKPKIIVAGITAYPKIIDWKKFYEIAQKVNAYLLCDISHLAGLIIGKAYPSPVPYSHILMTTTHKTLRGPRGAMILITKKGLEKDPELAKKIDKSVFPQLQGGPHINTIAGIGVALNEASKPKFKKYAKQVVKNCKTLAKELINYKFNLVANGTDSHLILVDLRNKGLLGNTVAEGLEEAGIILNRNSVPFDNNPPFYPSGLRIGTPGITSRGMKEKQMRIIAKIIKEVVTGLKISKNKLKISDIQERKNEYRRLIINKTAIIKELKKQVDKLCNDFPIKKLY
jgi:glycine hydroxymethyltransferase